MEKEDLSKRRKDRIPSKKEFLNNLNTENKLETDKWVDLKYFKKDSFQSQQILEKLSCDKIKNNQEIKHLSHEDYFKLIFKNINNEPLTEKLNEKVYQSEKIFSTKDINKLPLEDQVQLIFKKASVVSFDVICNILGYKMQKENEYANKHSNINLKDSRHFKLLSEKDEDYFTKVNKLSEKEILELVLVYGNILKSGNFIYKSEKKYDYITDLKKKDYYIKQRNTIIQLLQNYFNSGIKKNYFTGANEDILKEVLDESCEKKNGFYFLKESIFSKSKSDNFKNNYKDTYYKGVSSWQSFQYDQNIKLSFISDEQVLKKIEEMEINENYSNNPFVNKRERKYSSSYANLGEYTTVKKEDSKIKAPLAPKKNSYSSKELIGDLEYNSDNIITNSESGNIENGKTDNIHTYNQIKMEVDHHEPVNDYYSARAAFSGNNKKSTRNKNQENVNKIDSKEVANTDIGINLNVLKENLIKNYNSEEINKKNDLVKKIFSEFPELKGNPDGNHILNDLISELFSEINSNIYIKEIDDKEADKTWKVLLDLFSKGNSYKKVDFKKAIAEKNIQITDQNLNKLLKRIAVYSNQAWNIKE